MLIQSFYLRKFINFRRRKGTPLS